MHLKRITKILIASVSVLIISSCFLVTYLIKMQRVSQSSAKTSLSRNSPFLSETSNKSSASANVDDVVTDDLSEQKSSRFVFIPKHEDTRDVISKSMESVNEELMDFFSEAIAPPIMQELMYRDPRAFGEYLHLLQEAQRARSQDRITEFVDFLVSFVEEMKLHEMTYNDAAFVVNLCKKAREDLKNFQEDRSPELMSIMLFRVTLAQYTLPRDRERLVDFGTAVNEFQELCKMKVNRPVLERQRRYLLFMAQTEGMHRHQNGNRNYSSGEYYDYNILKWVLRRPPISSDKSIRKQITAAKIDIAAHLEYARRDFLSTSKNTTGPREGVYEREVSERYEESLSKYDKALEMVNGFEKEFNDKMNSGDRKHIAFLKHRAAIDRRRTPWQYH